MYNIYWSMSDEGYQGHERNVCADTVIQAFLSGVRIVREVLSSNEVEFLPINDTEFVIWLQGKCKGYLSIKQVGPKT